MKYPTSYLYYLIYFHGNRDYFECHEVLEEYWKEVDPKNRTSHWVGLIQIAVALYHYRRDNFKGALRTFEKALANVSNNEKKITQLGLDHSKLIEILLSSIQNLQSNMPYKSINLPIYDLQLLAEAQTLCKNHGFKWCEPSDLTNKNLIHRHTKRDRSQIILERQNALLKRKKTDRPC